MDEEERLAKIKKYYKYSYSGIITNTHGIYTMTFSGSDFDFDILFTTDNPVVIDGVYNNEKVTAYDVPKPKKKPNLTEQDLYLSDTFSFGQQIGQLTNISTTLYSLLPLFPEDSVEHDIIIKRLKQCCVNQSKQIDKTKIGQEVKCIPEIWNTFQRIKDDDSDEVIEQKELNNKILADKKPYFFKYKYKTTEKEINEYINKEKENARLRFGISLEELLTKNEDLLTEEEKNFIYYYNKYMPVIDSDCPMNILCHYIENIDFEIKKKIRASNKFSPDIFLPDGFKVNKKLYEQIDNIVQCETRSWNEQIKNKKKTQVEKTFSATGSDQKFDKEFAYQELKRKLINVCPNEDILMSHMVYLFYIGKPSLNKAILWSICGKQMYEMVRSKKTCYYFPIKDKHGATEFLYEKYQIEKFDIINAESPDNKDEEVILNGEAND